MTLTTLTNPRILIITPEVTYLPDRMGSRAAYFTAKAGGLADVSAALVTALFDQGADVHVAIPDYRRIFSDRVSPLLKKSCSALSARCPMTGYTWPKIPRHPFFSGHLDWIRSKKDVSCWQTSFTM